MNRKLIARRAFTTAADRLFAARDTGAVGWPEASTKLAALRAAYEKRKEAIDLADWVRSHELGPVFGMEG